MKKHCSIMTERRLTPFVSMMRADRPAELLIDGDKVRAVKLRVVIQTSLDQREAPRGTYCTSRFESDVAGTCNLASQIPASDI